MPPLRHWLESPDHPPHAGGKPLPPMRRRGGVNRIHGPERKPKGFRSVLYFFRLESSGSAWKDSE